MAIDTRAKRQSMLAFASPLAWQFHFEVDGSVDADDRAQLLHLYGGNPLDSPTPVVVTRGGGYPLPGEISPKQWIRARANALLDEKLDELVVAVKAAKPKGKRKRKITVAEHRLDDIQEIINQHAPPDVQHSLEVISVALGEAKTAASEFTQLRAEIVRHVRNVQMQARRRKRNEDAVIALLLS